MISSLASLQWEHLRRLHLPTSTMLNSSWVNQKSMRRWSSWMTMMRMMVISLGSLMHLHPLDAAMIDYYCCSSFCWLDIWEAIWCGVCFITSMSSACEFLLKTWEKTMETTLFVSLFFMVSMLISDGFGTMHLCWWLPAHKWHLKLFDWCKASYSRYPTGPLRASYVINCRLACNYCSYGIFNIDYRFKLW